MAGKDRERSDRQGFIFINLADFRFTVGHIESMKSVKVHMSSGFMDKRKELLVNKVRKSGIYITHKD